MLLKRRSALIVLLAAGTAGAGPAVASTNAAAPVLLSGMGAPSAIASARLVGDLPHQGTHPLLELPGIDTEIGVVCTNAGARLGTSVSKPAGRAGKLPAVLFVP